MRREEIGSDDDEAVLEWDDGKRAGGEWRTVETSWGRKDRVSERRSWAEVIVCWICCWDFSENGLSVSVLGCCWVSSTRLNLCQKLLL